MGLLLRDMISPLPNSVLIIILSFLPFKEAVKTSILSKRWQFIWFFGLVSETMDFDERLFLEGLDKNNDIIKKKRRRAFLDFLRRWLKAEHVHNYDNEKFRLAFSSPEEDTAILELENFVRFGLNKKVESVDLDFSDPSWNEDSDEKFPTFMSLPLYEGHEMLVSLNLFSCNLPVISGFSTFLALKNLSLGWIRLDPSDIINLLSKCPVLESLSFKKCYVRYFQVTAQNLKNLVMDKCFPPRPEMVLVNAPKLQSFKYRGVLTGFQFEYLPSLEDAVLDFGLEWNNDECTGSDLVCLLLQEISSVRSLTVCSYILQVISCGEEKPTLEYVKHLTLKTALDANEFHGITFLLERCPNLEVLTIDLSPSRVIDDFDHPFDMKNHAFFLEDSPYWHYECVRKTLRSIEVNGFKGNPNELVVLKFFLKYGLVLETLSFRLSKETGGPGDTNMKGVYMQRAGKLFRCQRASRRLKILLLPSQ